MKETIYTCDRCKRKQTNRWLNRVCLSHVKALWIGRSKDIEAELCEDCMKELQKFLETPSV